MMEVEFKAVAQKVVKDPISNGKSGPCLHRCFFVNQSIVLVFQYPKPGSYTNTELYIKVIVHPLEWKLDFKLM